MGRSRSAYLLGVGALLIAASLMLPSIRFEAQLPPSGPLIAAAIAVILSTAIMQSRTSRNAIDRFAQRVLAHRPLVACAVGLISLIGLAALNRFMDRPLTLLWHDEFQFHLQSQLLARFRLWMPPHPLEAFFDTFYVLMQPVYAPQSFPGAALLFVPTIWLSLPTWVMPLAVTGVACGLLWWVLSELIDPWCATVGLVVLLCSFGMQRLSTMYMAQVPMLMLGLAAFAAMLVWKKNRSWKSAALVGLFLGWAAITRPLDAVCYGAIVGIGMLPTFMRLPGRKMALTAGGVIAAALPFLALQAVFDLRVTGSVTKTPFSYYNERDQPALSFGAVAGAARPLSDIPQKQAFYDFFTMAFVKLHNHPKMTPTILWQNRLNVMQSMLGPTVLMLPIAAMGLAGLVTRNRLLLFALLPAFLLAYHWYPIFLFHYIAYAMPGLILLYALAPHVASVSVKRKWSRTASQVVGWAIIGMSIGAMIQRSVWEIPDEMLAQKRAFDAVLQRVRAPAIVLFTPPARAEDIHLELVYNDDVAWPDDAPIIRAHDRGNQNHVLFDYYARQAPQREVWRLDRTSMQLSLLGRVGQLASEPNRP